MEWSDDAIVLSAHRHGESSAVVSVLTRQHGRCAGLVRGGAGPRQRAVLAAGNTVRARWRGRLAEHLGTLACEPLNATGASLLDDADRLAALVSACALLDAAVPEREPHSALYEDLAALIETLAAGGAWQAAYVLWELSLLSALGFGLDLRGCAGGGNDRLAYVSPRTGHAVSLSAGEPYRDRLLPLPAFLVDPAAAAGAPDIAAALRLTGHFFERCVYGDARGGTPPARRRLSERLERRSNARRP